MIRIFDIIFSVMGLLLGAPFFLVIVGFGLIDTGAPIFRQKRMGRHQQPFVLIKFRTMKKNTEEAATHLVQASSVTRMGGFLRKTKLDELPQLWNVLKGEMSLVGPRPNLFNQHSLIEERDRLGVYDVRPGITGLAQIRGIDMSAPQLLAEVDAKMIQESSLRNYFLLIFQTVIGKGGGDRIKKPDAL